ncbi:MAG TPA: class I SAM-dependent methyltransferase [Candidatus Angelobacter sp.]|nr:class I SAM-dependent methyltransferase [Candidatus Angelobacter sp.]
MTAGVDAYKLLAGYYDDAYAVKKDLVDLPFYSALAKRIGGPVLEIACGTGRVLLPIAREGIEIHGVDNSPAMLNVLRKNLQSEPEEVRKRVSVSGGDMRTFRLGKKYPLVIIPFRPMQHMHTLEDQIAALKTAALHLEEDGVLAFNVFYPKYDQIFSSIGEEIQEMEWPLSSDPSKIVRRYFRKDSVAKISQIFTGTFIFRTFQGNQLVNEETESFKLSYYTYPHLQALFLLAGLESVEEYGSFAQTPLDNNSTEMIFVLRASPEKITAGTDYFRSGGSVHGLKRG